MWAADPGEKTNRNGRTVNQIDRAAVLSSANHARGCALSAEALAALRARAHTACAEKIVGCRLDRTQYRALCVNLPGGSHFDTELLPICCIHRFG
jgi:hypothetical protein